MATSGAITTRLVQLSDLHVSAAVGLAEPLQWLLDWVRDDPPDLVVATGDLAVFDPDDVDDRAAAAAALAALPCRVVAIPGNHDVGFFDEPERIGDRSAAFAATWSAERFVVDVAGWRLIGANVYRLGDPDHDQWLATQLVGGGPVALFVHQPLAGDLADGWELPPAARAAALAVIGGHDVRLVASGHRHAAWRLEPDHPALGADVTAALPGAVHVWAPSTTFRSSSAQPPKDPRPGAVEYTFAADGTWALRTVTAPSAV